MKVFWALNRATSRRSGQRRDVPERFSNVTTFGATSRRSREEVFQRRDIRGNVATFQRIVISNVATLDINVVTFQRGAKINVATFDINVATFQRVVKINVATLDINAAKFQRLLNSTSRRL